MTGTFYSNFSKRKNSTKQPTGGTQVTMYLKEGTSIEKPTFILTDDQFSYNYVSAFGHYYFVDDIKSVRKGVTEIDCNMDVLATYKSDIGSYYAFIERASNEYDTNIADNLIVVKNEEVVKSITTAATGMFTYAGFYVISVLNDIGSGGGFTCQYITDITNIEALSAYINTDWGSGASITTVTQWLQATFLKTAESIIDCIWVPIQFSALDATAYDTLSDMKIGVDIVTGVKGNRLKKPCIASESLTVSIPHDYNDYRDYPPYTQCRIFIPGYGMVDINPLDFPGFTVSLLFNTDISTGDTCCYIENSNGYLISTITYNVGVSCPVGKVGANVTGFAGSAISTVGGMIMAAALPGAGGVAAGISATASGINTLSTAFGPSTSVHGGKGGRAIIDNGLNVVVTSFIKQTVAPAELMTPIGLPLMQYRKISDLPGYIKCSDASVPIAGMGSEKEAVNEYLNSGFYYE